MYDAHEAARTPLILVVDDDDMMRALARETLEAEGYAVAEAHTGEEALQTFAEVEPAMVLLDVQMPGMSGLEVCSELRSRYPKRPVPIVIATGSEDSRSIDRAYEAGATDFIAKPVVWSLLGQRVRYLLRANRVISGARRNRTSLANAQRIAHIGSWELNTRTNEMYWTDEIFRIFGLEAGAVDSTNLEFWNRVHPADRELARSKVAEALSVSKSYSVEHRVILPDGSERYVQHQGEVSEDAGSETWMIGTLQDITQQKADQERILHLASYDSLTGLANRHLFMERLARATHSAKAKGKLVGLLYLDLDKFKRVNDTLGHAAGDTMLCCVADVLLENVRGSDIVCRVEREVAPEVSRLGGDEFTILLSHITSAKAAGDVARRVLEALPAPITIEGHEVSPTGSIGIAVYPMDGGDSDTLLKNADTAMYHAKELGRNNFQFYNESMNQASIRKLTLEAQLRRAMSEGGLELGYQPRVDMTTREVLGVEALLRWNHPELGKISPREVIPLAEETGLILELGQWTLEVACAQNKDWQDQGYEPVQLSVNVSSRQFVHHDLRKTISNALKQSGLDPRHLEIEITESLLLQDDEDTALILRDLRAMGVSVALDDFGTGYSSLSYITRFPLDTLKMDRCFVRDVDNDPSARGISEAVINIAHSLGARVVAEGIDAEEQAVVLQGQGCDEFQGFLFSGAVPPDEFVRFLKRREG
jgi:diguanylate cyclase (GGDEF)-like protein/PAS domain S-box-containing protein